MLSMNKIKIKLCLFKPDIVNTPVTAAIINITTIIFAATGLGEKPVWQITAKTNVQRQEIRIYYKIEHECLREWPGYLFHHCTLSSGVLPRFLPIYR